MPNEVSHIRPRRSRKFPQRLIDCVCASIDDSKWGTSRGLSSEYTPWAFFMIDTVSVHGFVPGFLDPRACWLNVSNVFGSISYDLP